VRIEIIRAIARLKIAARFVLADLAMNDRACAAMRFTRASYQNRGCLSAIDYLNEIFRLEFSVSRFPNETQPGSNNIQPNGIEITSLTAINSLALVISRLSNFAGSANRGAMMCNLYIHSFIADKCKTNDVFLYFIYASILWFHHITLFLSSVQT